MPADAAAFTDRLSALRARVGVGSTDAGVVADLRALLHDLDAATAVSAATAATAVSADVPAWVAASAQDALALALVHVGDPGAAADAYRDAATRWQRAGDGDAARASRAAAGAQAVAAGGSLDTAVADLTAALAGSTGLARAEVLGRLTRLAGSVGDHFEATRRGDEAAALLAALGYPDPDAEPPPAWLGAGDGGDLRSFATVVTTWFAVLATRGSVTGAWPTAGLQRLSDVTAALDAGEPTAARTAEVRSAAARLDALQDAYLTGADTPDPAGWQRDYAGVLQVVADAAGVPVLLASAHILQADYLSWAGRTDDAAHVLADTRTALETATGLGEVDRSTRLVEVIRRQVSLAATAGDSAAVSRFAGDGITAIEADRARLHLPYLQDSYLRDRRLIYVAGMAAARRLGDLELLLERADLVKARGTLDWLSGPPDPVARIRASLAVDEAVVYHLWADRLVLYVLTIDRDDIVCDRVLFTEAERADLDALITDFAALDQAARWPDTELPALGTRLLPADGAALLAGKRRLVLSPNGRLHQLPLHALGWQGRPLIESFAVSYAPNVAALTRRPRSTGRGSALVVGIGEFPALPRASWLANTEAEAADVARRYTHADLLVGEQATRAALADRAADGRLTAAPLLHLATHGDDGPLDDPLAARLLLHDGDVAGSAMSGWRLDADLVVLSACWSAQRAVLGRDGTEMFGDEVYGLQSAFFRAGARAVLGAMWPASDAVAPVVMHTLHERLAAGDDVDVALQSAMLAARRGSPLLYRWAPYKLTVLGRPPLPEETR